MIAVHFMIAGIKVVHKLQMHVMFQLVVCKDGGGEAQQNLHEHPLTKPSRESRRVQFASILFG